MTKVEEALDELERNHAGTDCQTEESAAQVLALVTAAKAEIAIEHEWRGVAELIITQWARERRRHPRTCPPHALRAGGGG